MAINLDEAILNIVLSIIIVSPVLWISGRALVGKRRATFVDAIWIVVLGTIIGSIIGYIFAGVIASIIVLIVWLGLVKHFFECGWLKALAISILAVIIFVVIAVVLSIIGFGLWVWI